MTNQNRPVSSPIKRRTVLRGAGVASGAALVGGTFSSTVAARCHKDFECGADEIYLKFEFNDDNCEFELEEGPSDFDEMDFEFQSAGNKDGDKCEPVFIEWQSCEYEVVTLLAKAGPNCQGDENPESPYEVDVTNPGGKQAAISNVQLCLQERDDTPTLGEWQVDLVYGDPIYDFSAVASYDGQNRLLQAYHSCGNYVRKFGSNPDEYEHCFETVNNDDPIIQDIVDEGDGTATAKLDPGSCDGEEFALVSYTTESCDFNGGTDQILYDIDRGTVDGDGVFTYEVLLPEVSD